MKRVNQLLLVGIVFATMATSCSKEDPDDPIIPNEEEVITTLILTLTPNNGGIPVELSFQDLDGDGGDPPIISEGILEVNTTYVGEVILLNEIETPAENITEEVKEEAEEHQFFYQTSINDLVIAYNDLDANGDPIGLTTNITTNATGSGTISVVLRHEPDKKAMGVSSGDITNAGGETDIEVSFNVDVQ